MTRERYKRIEFELDLTTCYSIHRILGGAFSRECSLCHTVIHSNSNIEMFKHLKTHPYEEMTKFLLGRCDVNGTVLRSIDIKPVVMK